MNQRPLPRILEKIRARKQEEIATLLEQSSLDCLQRAAFAYVDGSADGRADFLSAVTAPGGIPNVIAEVKKASPSKGVIREDFDPGAIAAAYGGAGAAAISCLTDTHFFQGKLDYITLVRNAAPLPVLRKDFILHPAQVYQSRAAGADAILLIARMLEPELLADLYALAGELSLGVLLEVHDEDDLDRAMKVEPALIGVNNRDLDTFTVDFENAIRLRRKIPPAIPMVAESGISTHEQVARLADAGVAAVLVGEGLMRQPDVGVALRRLTGAL